MKSRMPLMYCERFMAAERCEPDMNADMASMPVKTAVAVRILFSGREVLLDPIQMIRNPKRIVV